MNFTDDEARVYDKVESLEAKAERDRGIDRVAEETGIGIDRATRAAENLIRLGLLTDLTQLRKLSTVK